MKYLFTKTWFRLKFPGLTYKICIANFKQNKLPVCDACFSQQNEKRPNEDQQRLPQTLGCGVGRFVRRYNDWKYPHSYLNVRTRGSRRKFHLKTLLK